MHYNQISHFLVHIMLQRKKKKKKITTNTSLAIKIYILVTAANRSTDWCEFSACVYIQWRAVIECLNAFFPDNLYKGTLQWKEKKTIWFVYHTSLIEGKAVWMKRSRRPISSFTECRSLFLFIDSNNSSSTPTISFSQLEIRKGRLSHRVTP